jgi:UDP-GlcNAc:undecaprenyl-phosphate/decaprenyl-phosphate GlcNAc-1-phosphate transferase
MEQFLTNPLAIGAISLVVGVVLTYAVREAANRYGFVAKPKSDRWHKRPTAMMGGVAIFLTTLLMYAAFVPKTQESLIVIGASSFLFLVGLLDDILNIKPYQKLIGQLIGATMIVGLGPRLPITGYELVDIWITVFWLIGITNAINLLDNMDGLAAGIAAIASISLAIGFYLGGQPGELVFVMVFLGALLGFLFFNFNPASIFMGDCGSMFVGFLLASSVLLGQIGGRSRGIFSILAVPVLILFVPIFDTTFVTILRKLWGRKASQGGRDHTSHRLVALGLSERSAVLMIYGFAVAAGVLSILVAQLETLQSFALIGIFTAALAIVGVYLSKVKVYAEREDDLAKRNNAVFAFLIDVSYKRRIFEVFLDAFLIMFSYYSAYVLLFGVRLEYTANWDLFIRTAPLLVVLKLFAFLAVGVYRGLWRYTSVSDLITFTKGVVAGSVLSVFAILILYRFQNFSRAVFVVDAIILMLMLVGSRMAFRLIREFLPEGARVDGRRVLIYGAGDGGEMVLRELRNNSALNYRPVGFVDDDPLKKGKVINGMQVYDANGSLADICREKSIQEILISSEKISKQALDRVREVCRNGNMDLKRAELRIEPFDFE